MHTSQYTRAVFEGSLICRFKLSISSVSAQAASLVLKQEPCESGTICHRTTGTTYNKSSEDINVVTCARSLGLNSRVRVRCRAWLPSDPSCRIVACLKHPNVLF